MKHQSYYMAVAEAAAENSHATRKKVGACLVTKNQVILSGWNGMPAGMTNVCEYSDDSGILLATKKECIHAEINAVTKAAREGVSTLGSSLFVTLSPCIECAKVLVQAGVSSVTYKEVYRDYDGVRLLTQCGVLVYEYKEKKIEQ